MYYKIQLKSIKDSTYIEMLPKSAIGFVLSNLAKENNKKNILYITDENKKLYLLKKEINFFDKNIEVLIFPEWDTMPFDVSSPEKNIQTARIKLLNKLISTKNQKIILTSAKNIIQKVLPKSEINKTKLSIKAGEKLKINDLQENLVNCSYRIVNVAISPGEFSINNNMVDVVISDGESYRIKLSNTIESIKKFNLETQMTTGLPIDKIEIMPANEVILNKENILTFRSNFRKMFKNKTQFYEDVSNGLLPSGIENLMPLFYSEELETIFDYIDKNTFLVYGIETDLFQVYIDEIERYYKERIDNNIEIIDKNLLYIDKANLDKKLKSFINIKISSSKVSEGERKINLNIKEVEPLYSKNVNVFEEIKNMIKEKES